jgi:hypothetical protein
MTRTIASQQDRRTIAQRRADERIVRATVTADRVVLTPEEREFFDSPEHRDMRSLMQGNRAPFLS